MSVSASDLHDQQLHGAASEFLQHVEQLPPDARHRFLQDLMEAIIEHEASGDGSRLRQALKALRVTTQMNSRQDFLDAVTAAEDYATEPTVDAAEYLARQHERRITRSGRA